MLRFSATLSAILSAMVTSALAIAGTPLPVMKVLIAPGPMDQQVNHADVKVTVTISRVQPRTPLFKLPAFPDLVVSDAKGTVSAAGPDSARAWKASRAVSGELVIRYRVPVENTPTNGGIPPLGPRIDGKGFSAAGQTFLAILRSKSPYRILVSWDLSAMGPGATATSSFGDGDVELAAGPASRLALAAFMAGQLSREPPIVKPDGFSAAWSGNPGFDLHPLMQWTSRLHAWMGTFFQTGGDPHYRVFLRFNPANAGGGVAFPNSFVVTYGDGVTAESLKHILPHEMVHTWTANDLGKWYDEGDAVYYQALLPWRAGMISTEAYLDDINKTAARYYTNPELNTPEKRIIPNFWTDTWLNTLAYDRGALYFAVLDGKIRRASGNKRSVDDLVRAMIRKARAGDRITEATWIELLRREIGKEGVRVHHSMMQGGLVVPESGDYGPCFRRVTKPIRRFELGFKPTSLPDGNKQVEGLVEGSEAEKAGLRNGDVVSYRTITTDGVRRDPEATVTATVTRGGKTFPITFLPRGKAVDAFQWERDSTVPETACRAL
jgi:predicted metalloprotease with PDZ domain